MPSFLTSCASGTCLRRCGERFDASQGLIALRRGLIGRGRRVLIPHAPFCLGPASFHIELIERLPQSVKLRLLARGKVCNPSLDAAY
jgi:hypothetical protein